MCKYKLLLLLLLLSLNGFPQFVKNENASTAIRDLSQSAADWGDYDNDGDLDLAIGGVAGTAFTEIYRNDNGTFVNIDAGITPIDQGSIMWGDYDNDGDLDLLISGITEEGTGVDKTNYNITQIFRNDAGVFVEHINLVGVSGGDTRWGDFDNDDDLDIALLGKTDDNVPVLKIFQNNNDVFDELTLPIQPDLNTTLGSVSWGDYDNDTDLDLLVTGLGINVTADDFITMVLRNDNGTFVDAQIELVGLVSSEGKWADYDNDGDLDIVLSGAKFDNSFVSLIYQNSSNVFTNINASLANFMFPSFELADYDTDNDLDFIIGGIDSGTGLPETKLFRNENGVFVDSAVPLPKNWGISAWGDYDNDSDPDILFSGIDETFSIVTVLFENVLKANQSITFDPLVDKTYGDADVVLSATSSSALDVSFELVSGPASLSTNTLTITGVGEIIVRAIQMGNTDFNKAPPVQQAFTINKAVLTASMDDQTIVYGQTLPTFTFTVSGFVLGDDQASIIVPPTLSTTATNYSGAGVYTISGSGGVADNYTFDYVDGTLTINKASLTATADNQTIVYNNPIPNLTITYDGFVNDEDTSVIIEPVISTPATANSDAGSYPIILADGSAVNYDINLVNGELIINQATATISATNLEQIFDGDSKEATIVTDPAGLTYIATYNGSDTPPSALGTYDLEITIDDINYVGQASATFLIQLISAINTNHLSNGISIYPMPADQVMNIRSDTGKIAQIEIYNLSGQIILNEPFNKQIDTGQIRPGHYIIRLIAPSGTTVSTQNIIIK